MMRDEGGDWSYDGDWVTRRRGVLTWLCVAVHRELSHSALGRYAGAAYAFAPHATPPPSAEVYTLPLPSSDLHHCLCSVASVLLCPRCINTQHRHLATARRLICPLPPPPPSLPQWPSPHLSLSAGAASALAR